MENSRTRPTNRGGKERTENMALYKRPDLKAQGMTDEQIDFVMTEGNRSLSANYTLNSDVQAKIDAAVAEAQKAPVDVTQTDEYQKLVRERDMLRAIGSEDFAGVKPKFRETVFGMLDRSEKAPAISDQLKAIGEKYEEYFTPAEEPPKTPQFGGSTQGSAPTGKTGPSFMDTWGFVPKKT